MSVFAWHDVIAPFYSDLALDVRAAREWRERTSHMLPTSRHGWSAKQKHLASKRTILVSFGQSSGRPDAEMSKRVDTAWMTRTLRPVLDSIISGILIWNIGGKPAGSISYIANMRDLEQAELRLAYSCSDRDTREEVKQTVRLG